MHITLDVSKVVAVLEMCLHVCVRERERENNHDLLPHLNGLI